VADGKFTFTQLPNDPTWAGLKVAANEYILTDMMLASEQMRMHSFMERLYPDYQDVFKDVSAVTSLSCLLSISQLHEASYVEFLAKVRSQNEGRLYRFKVLQFYELATRREQGWGASVYSDGLYPSIAHAAKHYELVSSQHLRAPERLLHFYERTGYRTYADTIPPCEISVRP